MGRAALPVRSIPTVAIDREAGPKEKGPKDPLGVVRGERKPRPSARVSESPHAGLSQTQSRRLGSSGGQIPAEYQRWLRESGVWLCGAVVGRSGVKPGKEAACGR